ncbi:MAG: aminopeptidase P family protein [Alphaproteobacteria bacterium]
MDWPALARALTEAGVRRPVDEVRALLAGIAAGPEPIGRGWLELIDPLLLAEADGAAARAHDDARRALAARLLDRGAGDGPARVAALRAALQARGLAGSVVPRGDEHQGEYVPARAERLAWLTGFTGSAGVAVVLANQAAIFVDGRYTLQVRQQVDTGVYTPLHLIETPPTRWIPGALAAGDRLGLDPWLHGAAEIDRWKAACAEARAELVLVETNPVDAVWADQPPPPITPAVPHPLQFSGRSSQDKRVALADELKQAGQQAVVLSAPDSIAWLLNIRGADVPNTPFALSFAILHDDAHVELFMDPRKAVPSLSAHLGNAVAVAPPDRMGAALDQLAKAGATVRIDAQSLSGWIANRLTRGGARLAPGGDPCALPKACKNAVELDGIRAAHRRDGAALSRFLAWIAEEGPKGTVDELGAIARLAAIRAEGGFFRGYSFDTISGAGPNGAIVHYRASEATNRRLEPGSIYLVDSGGQYLDGTTDVTRSIAIGTPTDEMRDRFTRVLKGHIALATARFPVGTTGSQLDALARLPLWSVGLDYDHGTGHGVGSYLSVHEGPQRISKAPNTVALAPGMIVSNEPGFYKEGAFGIRIENLVAVRDSAHAVEGGRPMLEFETLTLAPIDRNLVAVGLLTDAERDWLNAYHRRVLTVIGPQVDAATRAWLEAATAPV